MGYRILRFLVQTLAGLGMLVGIGLALGQPGWSLLQLLGLFLCGGCTWVLVGPLGAACLLLCLASILGMAGGRGAFRGIFLPIFAVLSGSALLATVVLRAPSLGRRIEHGPFGPGGVGGGF